ncbi:(Fe-S)-binding protein [Geomicrobium sediminis]|uniref:Glycolate oxidase iron-sulfur subunit n=1 Tax=Geomicrobium sediminis TaxID=1347788 RepID=A0ABS2PGM1_9BACL|nr:(Fe-S)-binding protein [Geomicrobium sediminis]MBM7634584.1 glycolate oxidase iron-sulfur subunit [Geomicrobium sediminis]
MVDKRLAYQETFDCVQCGYCLPACPTYQTMNKETHSPRGRINLVKMAAEGKISYDDLKEPIDMCLGCRACETACPTNVQYGSILESAKEVLRIETKRSKRERFIESALFEKLLPHSSMLAIAKFGLLSYQRLPLQFVARKTGILNVVLPKGMVAFESIIPMAERSKEKKAYEEDAPQGTVKVAYFLGCLMDTMFSTINDQAIQLLRKAGVHVTVVKDQSCCGALQSHGGDLKTARQLAKKNIEAFESGSFDYIVSSIGGCGAMLVEYDHLLKDEPAWKERAERFSKKHADISMVLAQSNLTYNHHVHHTAVYQPSCHMTHVQKNVDAPLELIAKVPGLNYVPMDKQDLCCGSAGIYNIVNYEASMDILDYKMPAVVSAKPNLIITTNPGCHLQMKMGVEREGMSHQIQVKHLVEVIAESCL